jgi:hypothetical protein
LFPVVAPTGGTLTSSTLISFGVDPSDSTKQGLGAAVYSNTFCGDRVQFLQTDTTTYNKVAGDPLKAAGTDTAVNNLMNNDLAIAGAHDGMMLPSYTVTGVSASNCPGPFTNELDVPNAIELVFKTPYAVPNDRTFAEIECSTAQIADDATSGATSGACTTIASLNVD